MAEKLIATNQSPGIEPGETTGLLVRPKHRLFANWLYARRKALRLTQEELAKKAGLGVTTIHRYEQGDVGTARPMKLEQLAQALEVSFAHFEMVYNRSQEGYEQEAKKLSEKQGGLTEEQNLRLLLFMCEMLGTPLDYDDILGELPFEVENFKSGAQVLANSIRRLSDRALLSPSRPDGLPTLRL